MQPRHSCRPCGGVIHITYMTYTISMTTEKPILNFTIEVALLKQLDDFRFKHRFASRAAAVKWLLAYAIKQNPNPGERKAT